MIVSVHSFTISCLVPPKQIVEHQVPFGHVKEGCMVDLTCWTEPANPSANITWTRDGRDVTTKATSSVYKAEYNGWSTTSTFRIHTRRSDNKKMVQCNVVYRGQSIPKLSKTFTLNVTCELFFS